MPSSPPPATIAVIGFGHFGQLLVKTLLEHTKQRVLLVSSQSQVPTHPRLELIGWADIAAISQAEMVVPCVPINRLAEVLSKIAPHLHPKTIVIDVCSVKVKPVAVMAQLLPATTQLIASHPVFGPDSVRKNHGFQDLPLTLWNVRCDQTQFEKIVAWCQKLGLKVLIMSPEDHDRHAARSQAVAFLVGKLLQKMQISETPIDGLAFKLLMELTTNFTGHDTDELFFDLQLHNPFTPALWQEFLDASTQLIHDLQKRNSELKQPVIPVQ